MSKFIHITTQNGYVYRVPAEVVADDRARYYAEKDEDPNVYKEEYDYTLESDFELSDWFSGNMNWEDVADKAELVTAPEKDVPVIGQDETEIIDET